RSNRLSIEFAEFPASASRAIAALLRRSNSRASGGSFASGFPTATRFSSAEIIRGAEEPDLRLLNHADRERVALLQAFRPFASCVHGGIDRAAEVARRVLERRKRVRISEGIADDHDVDVAQRRVASLGQGAEDERHDDPALEPSQRPPQRLRDPDGLLRDRAKLREKRRIGVGLVVLLRTEPAHGHESGRLQSRELPLHRPRTRSHLGDALRRVEAAIRPPEEEPEHGLLRAGEERVCQSRSGRALIWLPTHFGYATTQSGYAQHIATSRPSNSTFPRAAG